VSPVLLLNSCTAVMSTRSRSHSKTDTEATCSHSTAAFRLTVRRPTCSAYNNLSHPSIASASRSTEGIRGNPGCLVPHSSQAIISPFGLSHKKAEYFYPAMPDIQYMHEPSRKDAIFKTAGSSVGKDRSLVVPSRSRQVEPSFAVANHTSRNFTAQRCCYHIINLRYW